MSFSQPRDEPRSSTEGNLAVAEENMQGMLTNFKETGKLSKEQYSQGKQYMEQLNALDKSLGEIESAMDEIDSQIEDLDSMLNEIESKDVD